MPLSSEEINSGIAYEMREVLNELKKKTAELEAEIKELRAFTHYDEVCASDEKTSCATADLRRERDDARLENIQLRRKVEYLQGKLKEHTCAEIQRKNSEGPK